jgi:hypothetical protein
MGQINVMLPLRAPRSNKHLGMLRVAQLVHIPNSAFSFATQPNMEEAHQFDAVGIKLSNWTISVRDLTPRRFA